MNRSNEIWLEHLGSRGTAQNEALAELRKLLMARLRHSFKAQGGIDESFLEDMVQEALIKVLKNLDQFEGRSRFTTWATTIAIRLAFTELRKRRWKDVSLDHVLQDAGRVPEPMADPVNDPGIVSQQRILIERMYQIINQDLSKKKRDTLLAELMGMPQEEIGRRTGSNRNAVYKLTHDARKRLKQELESSGYTIADVQTAFGW